jgi:hypothetical protein
VAAAGTEQVDEPLTALKRRFSMRNILLAAGIAALALAAPASAQKGGDKGGDRGGGKPAKVERGGGGPGKSAKGERRGGAKQARAERRGGGGEKRVRAERRAKVDRLRGPERQAKAERRRPDRQAKVDRVRNNERREVRADHDRGRAGNRQAPQARLDRDRDRRLVRIERRDDDRREFRDRRDGLRFVDHDRNRDRYDNCPPGLAAKNNGCLPPGQARKLVGRALPAAFASSLLPAAYRGYYPDTDDYTYRSGDGLIYRIARSSGLVDGYSPLWGYGADYTPDYYYPGERYPLDYVSFYNVPTPYQGYYRDDDEWLYRYGDGGIYQVNRSTGLVEGIVALLAGDLGIGQPLPAGYDVYNVPYAYRDEYYDTPDRWYRYNDGYIYQVDPQTRLVQAVIQALV